MAGACDCPQIVNLKIFPIEFAMFLFLLFYIYLLLQYILYPQLLIINFQPFTFNVTQLMLPYRQVSDNPSRNPDKIF